MERVDLVRHGARPYSPARGHDAHAEGAGEAGAGGADRAQADDAEGAAGEAAAAGTMEGAPALHRVDSAQVAEDLDESAEDELGDRRGAGAGGVRESDAPGFESASRGKCSVPAL
ncbi:MAG: hypothetical protein R3E53_04375 [Myxococcota bacterium]